MTRSKVALIYYPIYYSFGNYASIKTFSKYRIRTKIKSKCILPSPQNYDVVSIKVFITYVILARQFTFLSIILKICILYIYDHLHSIQDTMLSCYVLYLESEIEIYLVLHSLLLYLLHRVLVIFSKHQRVLKYAKYLPYISMLKGQKPFQ